MKEEIEKMLEYLNQRRLLQVRKGLNELLVEAEKYEQLKEFSKEIKLLVRNSGKSMFSSSEIEPLLVKFGVKLE